MTGNRSTEAHSYDDLVNEIYCTGSEHHDWQKLLGHVAEFIGARSGIIGTSDVSTGYAEPKIHSYGLNRSVLYEKWRDEFGFEDCWASQGYVPQEGEVLTGTQLLDPDELHRLSVYKSAFIPLGIEDCLMTSILTSGSRVMYVALYQNRAEGYFEKEHRVRLRALAPHLVRAARLEQLLYQSRVQERIQRAALDEIDLSIFLVRNLQAEPLNSLADELLLGESGIVKRGGALHALHPESNTRLQEGIEAAGGGCTVPARRCATPFAIRRPDSDTPRTGWVVPVSEPSSSLPGLAATADPGCALVFIADPDKRPEFASETISRLFGLTPSEARLAAAIAAGETPREYAERVGVSDNTVRWTLKQVQSKLGTRRQLEIASLLIRAAPHVRS